MGCYRCMLQGSSALLGHRWVSAFAPTRVDRAALALSAAPLAAATTSTRRTNNVNSSPSTSAVDSPTSASPLRLSRALRKAESLVKDHRRELLDERAVRAREHSIPPLPDASRLRRVHELQQPLRQAHSQAVRIYNRLRERTTAAPREERRAARFAVQAIGIAIKSNRLDMARELDNMFFSTASFDSPTNSNRKRRKMQGLGLPRTESKNAWVHAITLALDPGAYFGLADLSRAIDEMRKVDHADPVVFAALIHRANRLLLSKVSYEQMDEEQAQDVQDLSALINFVRSSERFKGVETVEFSFIESELTRFEQNIVSMSLDSSDFARLEAAVTNLTGGLDEGSFYSRQTATHAKEAIRQAHVLHLSLRFLLLQAELTRSLVEPGQRSAGVSHSLSAAHSLHDALLALVQLNASAPFVYALRERQIASLFRLLRAHLYSPSSSIDSGRNPSILQKTTTLSDVLASLSLLEDTVSVSTLVASPTNDLPDARRTNVDTPLLQRLLLALVEHLPVRSSSEGSTLLSSSSQFGLEDIRHSTATFDHVARVLNVIRALRVQDARCKPDQPTKYDKPKPEPVFWRYSILWHVVRAVLLSPLESSESSFSTTSSSTTPLQIVRTPLDRLDFMIDILDEMKEAGDKIKKGVVRRVVESVVETELVGEVWKAWRAKLRARITAWEKSPA